MLAESLDRGPTVSEVMGGIGYIFGLVGVALYFLNRGKRK
jgi:nickel transport protein